MCTVSFAIVGLLIRKMMRCNFVLLAVLVMFNTIKDARNDCNNFLLILVYPKIINPQWRERRMLTCLFETSI